MKEIDISDKIFNDLSLYIKAMIGKNKVYVYDSKNEIFFVKNSFNQAEAFFLKDGGFSRLDGPALIIINKYIKYFINDIRSSEKEFAEKTNHLICNFCEKFCKQKCFR